VISQDPARDRSRAWELHRLSAWDRGHPLEQSLRIDIAPYDQPPPVSRAENLTGGRAVVDPESRYIVIRCSLNLASWDQFTDPPVSQPRAVINVIDLRSFEVVAHRVLTEPLLAAGDMPLGSPHWRS
jgi:hypothetical protein